MVNTQAIRELLPHYFVVLVLIILSTTAVRIVLADVNIAIEFTIVMATVAVYVIVTRRLGYAPEQWT